MQNKVVLYLLSVSLIPVMIVGCSGQPTPNASKATDVVITPLRADYEVIGPDNIDRLELTNSWGMGEFHGFALSPDEKTLAVAMTSGVYLYDLETFSQKQFIGRPVLTIYKPNIMDQSISYSPDGKYLAIGYGDILIWNVLESRVEKWIQNRGSLSTTIWILFSPLGNSLLVLNVRSATSCLGYDGVFTLYDFSSGNIYYQYSFCPMASDFHFAFTDSGQALFIARQSTYSRNYHLEAIDYSTGEILKETDIDGYVRSLSPDGSRMAVQKIGVDQIDIIDTNNFEIIENVQGDILFLPEHKALKYFTEKEQWAVINGAEETACLFEDRPSFIDGDYYYKTLDIRSYITYSTYLLYWNIKDTSVEFWDLTTCSISKRLFLPSEAESLSNVHGYFVTGNQWGYLKNVWDSTTGDLFQTTLIADMKPPDKVTDIDTLTPNIASLVENGNTISILLWNIERWIPIKQIDTKMKWANYVEMSPDGRFIAVQGEDFSIFNTKTGTSLYYKWGSNHVFFNQDGSEFAQSGWGGIYFFKTISGKEVYFIPTSGHLPNIAISSDWSYLIFNVDKNIELWDLNNKKHLLSFPVDPTITTNLNFTGYFPLSYSNSSLTKLIINPSGNLLAAIHQEQMDYDSYLYRLRFYDLREGVILMDKLLPFEIKDLAFSSDGKQLVTLGDGINYVWRVGE